MTSWGQLNIPKQNKTDWEGQQPFENKTPTIPVALLSLYSLTPFFYNKYVKLSCRPMFNETTVPYYSIIWETLKHKAKMATDKQLQPAVPLF